MRTAREQNGAIRLPIVDIDAVLSGLKNPQTMALVHGTWRHVVIKATQMLEAAKRDQIDGLVQLDVKDTGQLLLALALTVEGMTDILFDGWIDNDDDEQI